MIRHGASTRRRSRSSSARPLFSASEASRASLAMSCWSRSPSAASRSFPTPRRATSSSTSRATRSGTSAEASSTSGVCSTPTRASRRCGPTTIASERLAFEGFVDRVHARLARAAGHARLPLRRPTRSARCGASRAVTARAKRRSTTCCAAACLSTCSRSCVAASAASVPGYGLKEMEAFLGFERHAEISDGGTSIDRVRALHADARPSILEAIADYNREDCVATLALRDWLLERRAEALARFGPFPLPEPKETKQPTPERSSTQRLRDELLHSGDVDARTGGRPARLPRPRAQARLVGVLRPGRAVRRGARRGRRVDRTARPFG